MSELHTEDASGLSDVINHEDLQADTGTVESGPELATGEGENPDKINQDAVQKRIDKATHKRYEAERAAKAAQEKSNALQAKLDEIENSKPAPTVSSMPDRFDLSDEEFEAAVKKRDAEVIALTEYEAKQQSKQAASQAEIQKQAQQREEESQRVGQEYLKRADKIGINRDVLQKAADTVVQSGIVSDVVSHIASHENGPLIVQHLANNPDELNSLANMNPMQAAVYISGALNEKAFASKPKTSNAPDPVTPLSGNGVDPNSGKYQNIKGAKFS